MNLSGLVCACSMLVAAIFLVRYVGINLSLSGLALSLLLLFHGPAYLYYTRVWGPDTEFFDHIMASAPGEPVVRNLDLAVSCLFIFVCLGIKFADLWLKADGPGMRQAVKDWGSTAVSVSVAEARRLRFWLVVIGVGGLLPFLFIDQQLSKIRDFLSIDLSTQDKADLRAEGGGGSAFYPYNVLLSTFAPFLAFATVAARRLSHRGWWFLGPPFLALLAIGKMATLSKAPLAVLILQLVVVIILCRSLQVRLGMVIGVTTAAAVCFALMAVIALPSLDGIELVAGFLFYRMFMIVNEGLVEYFAAIPYVLHFNWGAKMGWIAELIFGDSGLPNYWLVSQVHQDELSMTTSVMFLGDAWADWAWLGVIVFPFAFGLMLRALDIKLIGRHGKSVGSIAALALGQFAIFIALTRSLQTTLITGGLIFLLPFRWLISGSRAALRAAPAAPATDPGTAGSG